MQPTTMAVRIKAVGAIILNAHYGILARHNAVLRSLQDTCKSGTFTAPMFYVKRMTNWQILCTSPLNVLLHFNNIVVDALALNTKSAFPAVHHLILQRSNAPKSAAGSKLKIRHEDLQRYTMVSRMQLSSRMST